MGASTSLSRRSRITSRSAQKLGERERSLGLDSDDDAARWLAGHEPKQAPASSKGERKSKLLHRWKRRAG
jgi:hypothetical protein